MYFDETLTDVVHATDPYKAKGPGRVRNERDGIFRRQNGRDLVLDVARQSDGYAGTFAVAVT